MQYDWLFAKINKGGNILFQENFDNCFGDQS